MIFRFHHNLHGAHVRVGVFVATAPGTTFAKLGELTLGTADWPALRQLLYRSPGFLTVSGKDEGGTIDVSSGDADDDTVF